MLLLSGQASAYAVSSTSARKVKTRLVADRVRCRQASWSLQPLHDRTVGDAAVRYRGAIKRVASTGLRGLPATRVQRTAPMGGREFSLNANGILQNDERMAQCTPPATATASRCRGCGGRMLALHVLEVYNA